MSFEWSEYRLNQIGRIVTGKTPKGGFAEFEGDDVPFVTPPDFTGNKWISKTVRFISEAGVQSVKGSLIPEHSVLVTCIGSDMGKAAIAASRCVTNQQINAVIVDESRFCPEFLYYNLSLRKTEIQSLAGGSAQPILNKSAFGLLAFKAPNLDEQKLVSSMLRPLDDRITLLRETNSTLEAIAQALFKSWFVDFDPVRAKQEGRQPEGMDAETAALFPDSFEQSELGEIPKGWHSGTLNDLATLNPETWGAKNQPSSISYIDLANTKENQFESVEYLTFTDAPSRARRILRDGDTIVGTVRPGNRSFAFIRNPIDNLTASTGFAVLRPIKKSSTEFIFLASTQDASIEHLTHIADGAAYPAVRPDAVSGIKVLLPPDEILLQFHQVTESILSKVSENHYLAKIISNLRDTLLPQLISGQLRLPDAEEQLEAATAKSL